MDDKLVAGSGGCVAAAFFAHGKVFPSCKTGREIADIFDNHMDEALQSLRKFKADYPKANVGVKGACWHPMVLKLALRKTDFYLRKIFVTPQGSCRDLFDPKRDFLVDGYLARSYVPFDSKNRKRKRGKEEVREYQPGHDDPAFKEKHHWRHAALIKGGLLHCRGLPGGSAPLSQLFLNTSGKPHPAKSYISRLLKVFEVKKRCVLKLTLDADAFEATKTGEKTIEVRKKTAWIRSRLFDKAGPRNYDIIRYFKGRFLSPSVEQVVCRFISLEEKNEAFTIGPYTNFEARVFENGFIIHQKLIE